MPRKEWVIPRGDFAILIRRDTNGGMVVSFSVVLLAFMNGEWTDISRYDTAHGYAHRDVLGRNEGLRGKLPCFTITYEDAFAYAITDFKNNAEIYRDDFLAH